MKRIGVDLGGTKIEVVLCDESLKNVYCRKRIPTEQEKGYENIVTKIKYLVEEVKQIADEEVTIGIGIPGSVSPFTNLVRNANTQCLNNKNLKKDLTEALAHEIFIANDANCLTISEAKIAGAKDVIVGIIMGTGMGAGVMIHGKILEGYHGIAGEFGHATYDYKGKKCWCGNRGCNELYFSGTGLENSFYERTGKRYGAKKIYNTFKKGDLEAKDFWNNYWLPAFAHAIVNLICMFNPNTIIIGGGAF